ncbi:MAG: PAS domain S-box protein [Thermoleophilia bacterium]
MLAVAVTRVAASPEGDGPLAPALAYVFPALFAALAVVAFQVVVLGGRPCLNSTLMASSSFLAAAGAFAAANALHGDEPLGAAPLLRALALALLAVAAARRAVDPAGVPWPDRVDRESAPRAALPAAATVVLVAVATQAEDAVVGQLAIAGVVAFVVRALGVRRAHARARTALEGSDARLRSLVEAVPLGILVCDHEGRIVFANGALEAMVGWRREELLGEPVERLLPQTLRRVHRAHRAAYARDGRTRSMGDGLELRALRRDGSEVPVEVGISAFEAEGRRYTTAVINDVTERRALEERLREAQRLETVGRIAGGIAHDFNNLLTGINGFTELALGRLDPDEPLHRDLERIRAAGERAAALTRRLLAFGRRQVVQPRVVDVGDVVLRLRPVLEETIGAAGGLVLDIPGTSTVASADPAVLEHVVLDLAAHAGETVAAGGSVAIEVARLEIPDPAVTGIEVAPGSYVVLSVLETGGEGDDAARSAAFDPFTGGDRATTARLALAAAYGSVRQSGGDLAIEAIDGEVTALRVYLPALDEPVEAREGHASALGRSRGTLLLVEDEPLVRELTRQLLEHAGYRVLEAANGEEGLAVAEAARGRVDLLLTDVIMPGVNGPALARSLRADRPELPVLFMSGWTDDLLGRHGVLDDDASLLHKPFSRADLLDAVECAIDGGRERALA